MIQHSPIPVRRDPLMAAHLLADQLGCVSAIDRGEETYEVWGFVRPDVDEVELQLFVNWIARVVGQLVGTCDPQSNGWHADPDRPGEWLLIATLVALDGQAQIVGTT